MSTATCSYCADGTDPRCVPICINAHCPSNVERRRTGASVHRDGSRCADPDGLCPHAHVPSDPTADLTDDDVRRVCDEADAQVLSMICSALSVETNRQYVSDALNPPYPKYVGGWSHACVAAVARLRAERAERGTP